MKKKSKLFLTGVLLLSLTSCGYDGRFRYPCQDPANWEAKECKPPICTANGSCPADLVKQGTDLTKQEGTTNG